MAPYGKPILGEMRLCSSLIKRFSDRLLVKAHPWDVDEAAWFVVTGEVPLVRPIKAKINSSAVLDSSTGYTPISLEIQPWVPPETVESAYRQVQRQVIGNDNRHISEKNLHLLRFVTKQANAEGNFAGWTHAC
jgi:hypothetical protein